jgi:hypothetical protein
MMIAHAMVLAVLVSLVVPHHAAACVTPGADLPAITATAGDDGDPSRDPADRDLVQHASCASCSCHTGILASAEPPPVAMTELGAVASWLADRLPPPSPASLPFKPPRA